MACIKWPVKKWLAVKLWNCEIWDSVTLVKHKWGDFDLIAFNVTAFVSIIKQSVKAHGPLVSCT